MKVDVFGSLSRYLPLRELRFSLFARKNSTNISLYVGRFKVKADRSAVLRFQNRIERS